jgi:hypothetical protein
MRAAAGDRPRIGSLLLRLGNAGQIRLDRRKELVLAIPLELKLGRRNEGADVADELREPSDALRRPTSVAECVSVATVVADPPVERDRVWMKPDSEKRKYGAVGPDSSEADERAAAAAAPSRRASPR